jgi:hypothetical protein
MPYKDPQKAKEYRKLYYQKNKEKMRLLNLEWRNNNPEKSKAIYARYGKTEKRRLIARDWARANREKGLKRFVERYNTDPQFNIAIKFRRRIYMAVRNQFTVKAKKTTELLGITYQEFKEYIEEKFTEDMSWDKVLSGEIHLDHIKPVSLFDLSNINEQREAFNYKNLQPLWALDNMKKHCKIDNPISL